VKHGKRTFGEGAAGDEQPKVVVRDKRRIDPVTGEIRVPPAGEQPAGGTGSPTAVDDSRAAAPEAPAPEQGQPQDLQDLQAQLDERTDDLQRLSAEYSNYRRRVERDRQLVITVAKAQLIGQLLPVLDDIDRAEEHGDLSGPFKAVADKLVSTLQAQGLQAFGAVGDSFDPAVHEAVQHTTSPEVHKPTVTAVLRRGYRFGDRVLRAALVAVTDAETPGELSPDAATFRSHDAAETLQD
jgi:molecular chaperone GrpE